MKEGPMNGDKSFIRCSRPLCIAKKTCVYFYVVIHHLDIGPTHPVGGGGVSSDETELMRDMKDWFRSS